MKVYHYEVNDRFFPSAFEGEIRAENKEKAIAELEDWYAMELGTDPEELSVKVY